MFSWISLVCCLGWRMSWWETQIWPQGMKRSLEWMWVWCSVAEPGWWVLVGGCSMLSVWVGGRVGSCGWPGGIHRLATWEEEWRLCKWMTGEAGWGMWAEFVVEVTFFWGSVARLAAFTFHRWEKEWMMWTTVLGVLNGTLQYIVLKLLDQSKTATFVLLNELQCSLIIVLA